MPKRVSSAVPRRMARHSAGGGRWEKIDCIVVDIVANILVLGARCFVLRPWKNDMCMVQGEGEEVNLSIPLMFRAGLQVIYSLQ